jgi:glycosyltransferase involved in cell wall biosynthesis
LVALGHDVEVATTNVDGREISPVPVSVPVTLDNVRVRYFSSEFQRLYWAPSLARALRRQIAEFDLVHLHSVFLWPTWAVARMARKAAIPHVISPRGMLVKDLIKRRSPLVKSAWINVIEKSNIERASAIHATSELEAHELRRFQWRLPDIAIIPNGVDEIKAFADSELSTDVREIAAEQPLVLFLGRVSWKKGLDRLLEAFALSPLGTLAIVGPDDENLVPRLSQLARRLNITKRVRFLSRVVLGADKEYLMASARLFVLPSYSENFGNAVLEAMQRGVPVIVTPEVGAAEIVREAGGGIVTQGGAGPLSDAMNRLLRDQAAAASMGQAGQRIVLEHYTWRHIAVQMEALYERLIA